MLYPIIIEVDFAPINTRTPFFVFINVVGRNNMMTEKFTIMDTERFWVIWLGCLEKPRSLTEVSNEFGYKTLSQFYQKLQGKLINEWMVEKHYLQKSKKVRKGWKYLSLIEPFLHKQHMHSKFWNSPWVRSSLLSLKNIKALYKVKEWNTKLIRKVGHDFYPIAFTWVAIKATEAEMESRNMKRKDVNDFTSAMKATLELSHMYLDIKKYVQNTEPILEKHKEDLLYFINEIDL